MVHFCHSWQHRSISDFVSRLFWGFVLSGSFVACPPSSLLAYSSARSFTVVDFRIISECYTHFIECRFFLYSYSIRPTNTDSVWAFARTWFLFKSVLIYLFFLSQEVRLTSLRKLHTEVDLRSLGTTPNTAGNFAYTPGCSSLTGDRRAEGVGNISANPSPPGNAGFLDKPRTPDGVSDDDMSCQYTPSCCIRPSIIDGYSRVLFPLSFLIFNSIYWVTYLNISEDFVKGDDFVYVNSWNCWWFIHTKGLRSCE